MVLNPWYIQVYCHNTFINTVIIGLNLGAYVQRVVCQQLLPLLSADPPPLSPQLRQESHQALQDVQLRVRHAAREPTQRHQPRHLHLAQRRGLEAELERAGRTSQALGRVVSLANQMTLQGLCSHRERELTAFLDDVIQVGGGG